MATGGGYYHPAYPGYEQQQYQNCGYQQPAPPPSAGYETTDHSGGLPDPGRTVEWYQWNYLEEMRQKDFEKMTFVLENEKKKRQQMEKSLWNAEKRQIKYIEEYNKIESRLIGWEKEQKRMKTEIRARQGRLDDMKIHMDDTRKKMEQLEREEERVAKKEAMVMPKHVYYGKKKKLDWEKRQVTTEKWDIQRTTSIRRQEEINRLNQIEAQRKEIEELKGKHHHLQKIYSLLRDF